MALHTTPALFALLCLGCCQLPPERVWRGPTGPTGPHPNWPLQLHAPLEWKVLARTVQGRPIRRCDLGQGYRRVLWIGGIHGNEHEGAESTEELPTAFRETPQLAQKVTLTMVEDLNPDGSAARRRGNANGVDLNRDFPARNYVSKTGRRPLSQPESRALCDLILDLQPDLVIVVHSWRNKHFINFDGPAADLARMFSEQSGYPVLPSKALGATPGSLGSWVGKDLVIPILTLEYERGVKPEVAWQETRAAILAVIDGDVKAGS